MLIENLTTLMTAEELADYGKLSPEGKRLLLRYKFKTNFLALTLLLGYKDIGECHRDKLIEIAKLPPKGQPQRRLWLWARGHFKTSLISEAKAVYRIINDVNRRLLVVSYTLDVAKTILKNIKAHFVSNDDFRFFFKDFCPSPSKDGKIEFGTTEQFTIPNRTRNLKEPTLMCAGVGTNLTGLHFDEMIIDDLVTRDSVTNETQIQASKDYYASLRQLFDNPTIPVEDIIGTPYHFADLYQDIIKSQGFKISNMPAIINGKSTFSERFTLEGLEAIENDPTVGPYEFAAQYLLNPINPKDAKFLEKWLINYDKLPEGLAEYICVDPASTQKKKSDYTVIEHWGVDSKGNHYFIDGIRDKLTSFQRIDLLFEIVSRAKNLKWVKYEVLGGRHGDLEVINERMHQRKVYFTIKETKGSSAAKKDRIEQRLVGRFNSGIIFFPRTCVHKSIYDGKSYDFVQQYRLEFLQFPFTEHDDILDCHSQMFEEELIRGKDLKGVAPDDLFMKLRQMVIDKRKRTNNYPTYQFGHKSSYVEIPCQKSLF